MPLWTLPRMAVGVMIVVAAVIAAVVRCIVALPSLVALAKWTIATVVLLVAVPVVGKVT